MSKSIVKGYKVESYRFLCAFLCIETGDFWALCLDSSCRVVWVEINETQYNELAKLSSYATMVDVMIVEMENHFGVYRVPKIISVGWLNLPSFNSYGSRRSWAEVFGFEI